MTHTRRVRELPDGAGTLGIFRSATKNVGPISARDFVDVTVHRRVDANTMVSAGAGLGTRHSNSKPQ